MGTFVLQIYLWVDQLLESLLQVANYLGHSLAHPTNQVPNWIRLSPSSLVVPPEINSLSISTKSMSMVFGETRPGSWWKVGGRWWVANLHLHPPALILILTDIIALNRRGGSTCTPPLSSSCILCPPRCWWCTPITILGEFLQGREYGSAHLLLRLRANVLGHIGANLLLHWHSHILLHV